MHIDIPRAQLLIEERDTMETIGKLLLGLFSLANVPGTLGGLPLFHTYSPLHKEKRATKKLPHFKTGVFFSPLNHFPLQVISVQYL